MHLQGVSMQVTEQKSPLQRFCVNLTAQAKSGNLDPVIGRHDEIRRVIHILSRRTKNNPLLLGDPGVGKTAIVEGIAQRIVSNDVPEALRSSVIYSLDLGLLLGGAKYQGEFEERLKSLLKEIEDLPYKIILFIDEIHMIVGAGGAGGALDASNLLKPALARGMIHCIGATTIAEWKKYIEKDAALERRFQRVSVEEPSAEDALSIVRGLKERYELHHGIKIKDQALVAAVKLSMQYIPERFLPDKAIDLIDEAAAMLKMTIDSLPPELDILERKLRQLEIERVALAKEKDEESKKRIDAIDGEKSELTKKRDDLKTQWKSEKEPLDQIAKLKGTMEREELAYQAAEREGNYERASKIRYGTLVELQRQIDVLEQKRSLIPHKLIKEVVDEHDIAHVVARWSGVPVTRLTENEQEKYLRLEDTLTQRVIGQKKAVHEISRALKMHRAGLVDPKKPLGSFLFLGPTGVGKTEIAKAVADVLFNDEHCIIRIDMSEYMEKHSVARLIGAPPGYVGYEEGGQLTEALRRRPYSVVLFDEFEKAHPDVWNVLLQLLDEGHLTDSQGRNISAKNAVIIMTSNVGSQIIMQADTIDNKVEQDVLLAVKQIVRPELINRIDSVIVFNKLTLQDVEQIAHIHIKELVHRCVQKNIVFTYDESVVSWLAHNGYDPEYGARPLKRLIQHELAYPIAHKILESKDGALLKIHASIINDAIALSSE